MRHETQDFDRDVAIRRWRNSLLSRGGLTTDDVDELQDHLQGVEAELLDGHMSTEEAFWLAAHRVGTPEALTREFNAVKPLTGWLLRFQWALIGIVALWLAVPAGHIVVGGIALGLNHLNGLPPAVISTILSIGGSLVPLLLLGLAMLLMKVAPADLDRLLSIAGRNMFLTGIAIVAIASGLQGLSEEVFERVSDLMNYPFMTPGWLEPIRTAARYTSRAVPFLIFLGPIWLQRERERRGLVNSVES